MIKHLIWMMLIGATSLARAEGSTAWVMDYMPSDQYESVIGFGVYDFKDESYGYYGSVHISITATENYYDFLNVKSFGDPVTDRFEEIMIFDVGLTKRLSLNMNGYAGIGVAFVEGYAEKYDSTFTFSVDGRYVVPDTENDRSGGNINLGLMLNIDSLSLNIGVHSYTKSAYVGFGFIY